MKSFHPLNVSSLRPYYVLCAVLGVEHSGERPGWSASRVGIFSLFKVLVLKLLWGKEEEVMETCPRVLAVGSAPPLAESWGGLEGFPGSILGQSHSCFTDEETEAESHTTLSTSPASERALTFVRGNQHLQGSVSALPPMVCGLETWWTADLRGQCPFAQRGCPWSVLQQSGLWGSGGVSGQQAAWAARLLAPCAALAWPQVAFALWAVSEQVRVCVSKVLGPRHPGSAGRGWWLPRADCPSNGYLSPVFTALEGEGSASTA